MNLGWWRPWKEKVWGPPKKWDEASRAQEDKCHHSCISNHFHPPNQKPLVKANVRLSLYNKLDSFCLYFVAKSFRISLGRGTIHLGSHSLLSKSESILDIIITLKSRNYQCFDSGCTHHNARICLANTQKTHTVENLFLCRLRQIFVVFFFKNYSFHQSFFKQPPSRDKAFSWEWLYVILTAYKDVWQKRVMRGSVFNPHSVWKLSLKSLFD